MFSKLKKLLRKGLFNLSNFESLNIPNPPPPPPKKTLCRPWFLGYIQSGLREFLDPLSTPVTLWRHSRTFIVSDSKVLTFLFLFRARGCTQSVTAWYFWRTRIKQLCFTSTCPSYRCLYFTPCSGTKRWELIVCCFYIIIEWVTRFTRTENMETVLSTWNYREKKKKRNKDCTKTIASKLSLKTLTPKILYASQTEK